MALKDSPYTIAIGHDILGEFPKFIRSLGLGKDALIISHPVIERSHGPNWPLLLKKQGIKVSNVPEGEKSKSAAVALHLIKQVSAYDVDKKIFIIALGAGLLGIWPDLWRPFINAGYPIFRVPTTLLAQIDLSIGGKTAIDLATGKNLVGAFYQPRLVFTDTMVLKTLNQRQIRNGLAEAVKYGIIGDPKLLVLSRPIIRNFLKVTSRS